MAKYRPKSDFIHAYQYKLRKGNCLILRDTVTGQDIEMSISVFPWSIVNILESVNCIGDYFLFDGDDNLFYSRLDESTFNANYEVVA